MNIDLSQQLVTDRRRDLAAGFEASRRRREARDGATPRDETRRTRPRRPTSVRQTLKRISITSPSATS
jgi:hypothetical protein